MTQTTVSQRIVPTTGATGPHIYDLVRTRARTWPDAPALGGQEGLIWKTLSSHELLQLVDALACDLADLGVHAGDRVVLWLPNHWRTPVYLFALWKLGAVAVPFDREMNPEAGARIISSIEPRYLVVGSGERPAWAYLAPLLEWWEPGTRAKPSALSEVWVQPDEELALISFTSGTTGEPKGCMITHANLTSQVAAFFKRIPLGPGCRLASILPLSHLFELTAGLLYPIAAGAAVHYAPSRRGPDIVRVLAEQHATHMMAVPQLLTAMGTALEERLQTRLTARGYRLARLAAEHLPLRARRAVFWPVHRRIGGQLRLIVCGGAPLPVATHQLWESFGVRVVQGYGTSECSPGIACGESDGTTPAGSVGRPMPGVEVRVDSQGEVLVKGPNVMRGYWKDPGHSAEVLHDGWYTTGDLGRIDAQGNLWLDGRARDLIVLPSGLKVWPDDVESILRSHPAVKDAAVIAVPAPGGGATLHGYLLATPGRVPDPSDLAQILAACNARLAQHQRLASAAWWQSGDFPRTAMLKVRRHLLPRPLAVATVQVESVLAADDPVSQAIAGAAHLPGVQPNQTLGELGLDSLGLVDLALALEDKVGKVIGDGDLRLEMTVAQVHQILAGGRPDEADAAGHRPEPTFGEVPLWPYTWGRVLRALGMPVDLLYAVGVSRTLILGREHLEALPPSIIFAGTHHGFADMPLVQHAISSVAGWRRRLQLVTAIAANGFNSGGPQLGGGLGLYPWYGIVALGLFPLQQYAERDASLRRLVRIALAGNDVLIFPQGTHARPAAEYAEDPAVRFHPGVAHLARALNASVLPFGVAGTESVMPPDPSAFHGRLIAGVPVSISRGPLAVAFGQRLTIEPDEEPDAFAGRLQAACYALTRQAEHALVANQSMRQSSA